MGYSRAEGEENGTVSCYIHSVNLFFFVMRQEIQEAPSTRWGRTKYRFADLFDVSIPNMIYSESGVHAPGNFCSTLINPHGQSYCPHHIHHPTKSHSLFLSPSMIYSSLLLGMYVQYSIFIEIILIILTTASTWLANCKTPRRRLLSCLHLSILRSRHFHHTKLLRLSS